jgi:Ca2+-binding EF-hand superfamily protein
MYRVKNVIARLQEKYPQAYFGITSFQLILYFVLGSHWFACIFFWIQFGAGAPPSMASSDLEMHLFQNGWAVAADFIDAQGYLLKWVLSPQCGTSCTVVTENRKASRGAMFYMFDIDRDKFISKDESFFAAADTDNSRHLSFAELEAAYGRVIGTSALERIFDEVDEDKQGEMSLSEFKQTLMAGRLTLFSESVAPKFSLMGGETLDTDGDGRISQAEYDKGFDLLDLR